MSKLVDSETQLSSVVAKEKFEQNIYGRYPLGQTLESEVSFIRLPGGAEWLGFRDVRTVSAGRGQGRASYADFRRFGTSARIVPQAQ